MRQYTKILLKLQQQQICDTISNSCKNGSWSLVKKNKKPTNTYLLQDDSARKQPYPMEIQAGSEKYQTSCCTIVFRLKVT